MFSYVSLFAGIDPVAGVQPNRDEVERARETQPAHALFGAPQDQVAISRQAEQAAALRQIADEAIAAAERPQDARLLDKRLPELIADHRGHLAEAERRLGALMERLGFPATTPVEIGSRGEGVFRVKGAGQGGDERLSRLQAAIHDDPETLSAFSGAHASATLSRISAAMGNAMQAAQAHPQQAESYYAWMRSAANDTLAMNFSLTYRAGALEGDLLTAEGRRLAPYEDLPIPA